MEKTSARAQSPASREVMCPPIRYGPPRRQAGRVHLSMAPRRTSSRTPYHPSHLQRRNPTDRTGHSHRPVFDQDLPEAKDPNSLGGRTIGRDSQRRPVKGGAVYSTGCFSRNSYISVMSTPGKVPDGNAARMCECGRADGQTMPSQRAMRSWGGRRQQSPSGQAEAV